MASLLRFTEHTVKASIDKYWVRTLPQDVMGRGQEMAVSCVPVDALVHTAMHDLTR